jgi:hypothetical protein
MDHVRCPTGWNRQQPAVRAESVDRVTATITQSTSTHNNGTPPIAIKEWRNTVAVSSNSPVVFEQLKQVMQRHADQLVVRRDEPTSYLLITKRLGPNKQPHYFPVYVYPNLLDTISPRLKKRMQGNACFNFNVMDPEALTELTELTERGFGQITSD